MTNEACDLDLDDPSDDSDVHEESEDDPFTLSGIHTVSEL